MTDMTKTIEAKSDQLNSDDLLGGSLTIKITKVSAVVGEQPISLGYEGDNGKPFKPCKTVRRILVGIWGKNGADYVGRSMTLYRDPKVVYAGAEVGGIRVSHMSDMKEPVTLALTATKKSKKVYTIWPLPVAEAAASGGKAKLEAHWNTLSSADKAALKDKLPALKEAAAKVDSITKGEPTV
jgi:hypothetical protein